MMPINMGPVSIPLVILSTEKYIVLLNIRFQFPCHFVQDWPVNKICHGASQTILYQVILFFCHFSSLTMHLKKGQPILGLNLHFEDQ